MVVALVDDNKSDGHYKLHSSSRAAAAPHCMEKSVRMQAHVMSLVVVDAGYPLE